MSRYYKIGAAMLVVLAVIVSYNTFQVPPPAPVDAAVPMPPVDQDAVAQRLAGAVRIATVSYTDRTLIDNSQLDAFAAYLQKSFPRVDAALTREVVNGHSLLYTWTGKDPAAKPLLFLAHMDVVPVEPAALAQWTHPPFSGDIADGYIWGRGTLDDKGSLMAWMEAAEQLLAAGFQPGRTIYFAFGADEEIGGAQGAAQIATLLRSRGVHAEFALDEGGVITQGVVDGVSRPVASIMAAEKGYVSFRLTAHAPGGHSSMPPQDSAIARLAHALVLLQNRPMPARLESPVTDMLDRLTPEMPRLQRIIMANRWLTRPLIVHRMSESAVGNALVRTTTALTQFQAGIKDNVLPGSASAVVNFRLLPGNTIEQVEHHVRLAIADDGIDIAREGDFAEEASPVSDIQAPAFKQLAKTVNEIFPQAVVTTGIVVGATDLRHYAGLYDNRYNFLPNLYTPDDLPRIHGSNERISVSGYADMIRFYMRLLHNAAGA
ncbi:MAG: M20 family peptidase [Stenotrophobium sp.]